MFCLDQATLCCPLELSCHVLRATLNIFTITCERILLLPLCPDEGGGDEQLQDAQTDPDSQEETGASQDNSATTGTAPDSPSKQLPDQISFFSGNPSVEIVHGIMHLYKTK